MQAGQILQQKGDFVATIAPSATVRDAIAVMHRHGVGALVATDADDAVVGIVSERDVVRGLHRHGAALLDRDVASLMKSEVVTCGRDTSTADLMATMTTGRFRHVPVVDDGRLVGIVSIGDVVKVRIDELALEREQLADYIAAGG